MSVKFTINRVLLRQTIDKMKFWRVFASTIRATVPLGKLQGILRTKCRMIRGKIRLNGTMDEPVSGDGLRASLGERSIVLVGLMGCGKSSVGKRLAAKLGMPFIDADEEIERVADKSIVEIFADHGEEYFRSGERRVIARLLGTGPHVLATGGGAFINPETRANIKERGISIWLRAEMPILMRRVLKRDTRPLLKTADPEAVMRDLMTARYPIYAEADITVESREVPHDTIVAEVMSALRKRLTMTEPSSVSKLADV